MNESSRVIVVDIGGKAVGLNKKGAISAPSLPGLYLGSPALFEGGIMLGKLPMWIMC
ncbi:MAG TPA: hypothetical protein VN426_10780 [Syntrophomonadaceae bacterium]|nr:hypothetical protein [Syntrophomonadaceae bacterium]